MGASVSGKVKKEFMAALVPFFVVLIIVAIVIAIKAGDGGVRGRFRRLGNLQGKTMEEIIKEVGRPNSITKGHNYALLQWQEPGYHIAIKFVGGIFSGISHEWTR
jgi:hypothetical protein